MYVRRLDETETRLFAAAEFPSLIRTTFVDIIPINEYICVVNVTVRIRTRGDRRFVWRPIAIPDAEILMT